MEVLNALEAFLRVWMMHVATGFGASVTHVLALAGSGPTPITPSFEDALKNWTGYLADGVEGCAGLVIAFAAIQATIRAILLFFRKPRSDLKTQVPQTENFVFVLVDGLLWHLNSSWRPIFCVQLSHRHGVKSHNLLQSLQFELG